jgi:glutaredoxin
MKQGDHLMKTGLFLILTGCAMLVHAADMYRWVDEKGVVNYTPYPPPASIKKVEQKKIGGNYVQTTDAPASANAQLAAKNFPVTFYATPDCDTCKIARAHLEKRGVPFTEKNAAAPDEFENFRKLSGGNLMVPLLLVGPQKPVTGYLPSEWDAAFDQAGYPGAATPGAKPAAKPLASAPPATAK